MIDVDNKVFPVFDNLMGTCKRWVSDKKDVGISLVNKERRKEAFMNWLNSGESWVK